MHCAGCNVEISLRNPSKFWGSHTCGTTEHGTELAPGSHIGLLLRKGVLIDGMML